MTTLKKGRRHRPPSLKVSVNFKLTVTFKLTLLSRKHDRTRFSCPDLFPVLLQSTFCRFPRFTEILLFNKPSPNLFGLIRYCCVRHIPKDFPDDLKLILAFQIAFPESFSFGLSRRLYAGEAVVCLLNDFKRPLLSEREYQLIRPFLEPTANDQIRLNREAVRVLHIPSQPLDA